MTYDKLQWFWLPQAAAACAADGAVPNGAWCTDYYYRNTNTLLRTAALTTATTICAGRSRCGPRPGDAASARRTGGRARDALLPADPRQRRRHRHQQVYTP